MNLHYQNLRQCQKIPQDSKIQQSYLSQPSPINYDNINQEVKNMPIRYNCLKQIKNKSIDLKQAEVEFFNSNQKPRSIGRESVTKNENDPQMRNMRCSSMQWNSNALEEKQQPNIIISQKPPSSLKQAENQLIKENETLRNLVTSLRLQVKTLQYREVSFPEYDEQRITEVNEEQENSSRFYSEEVERLRKQLCNDREKYHQLIVDLEKKIVERDLQKSESKSIRFFKQGEMYRDKEQQQILTLNEEKRQLTLHYSQISIAYDELKVQYMQKETQILNNQIYVEELEQKSEDLLQQNQQIILLCQDLQNDINQQNIYQPSCQTPSSQEVELIQMRAQNQQLQSTLQEKQESYLDLESRFQILEKELKMVAFTSKNQQESMQKSRVKCLEMEQSRDRIKRELVTKQEQNEQSLRNCEIINKEKERLSHENQQVSYLICNFKLLQINQRRKDEFDSLFNDLENVQNELMVLTVQFNKLENEKIELQNMRV